MASTSKMIGYELKVGITAGLALLLLTIMIFTVKRIQFGQAGYPVYITFEFVDAIKPNADVVIGGGVKVGQVAEIKVVGERIRLKLLMNPDVKIPRTARFQILSKGLMGDKYVNIVAVTDTGEYLKPGAEVAGVEPTNIDKAFQRLGQVADSVKMMLGNPEVQDSFGETLRNIGKLSGRLETMVRKNEKRFTQGMDEFASAAGSLNAFARGAERLTPNLEQMASNQNAKHLSSTLKNLESITTRLEAQVNKMEKGEGTIGVLVNDKQLAQDLKDLLNDVKKNPWKLLWKQ